MAHVQYNTGDNEWYTPIKYIVSVRKVLGEIDLDPASSDIANLRIQAKQFYTVNNSGLEQDWHGKVYMNPPYARGYIDKFISKFVSHYISGDITEGIILCNNATETKWFQPLFEHATLLCFIKGRVKFDKPVVLSDKNSPLQGQVFVYFGQESLKFSEEFSQYGPIIMNLEDHIMITDNRVWI